MGNSKKEYYLTQEYKDYRLSLIQNRHFIETLQNGREGAYGRLFYIEDLRKKYTIFSNLLYVVSGILIGIALWMLLCSHGNTAALICCLTIYLGIFPCLIFASKLSKMNKYMVGRTAFDNYGYEQKLRERIEADQRHATWAIKLELSKIENAIIGLTHDISKERSSLQQKELYKKLKELHYYITEYERLSDEYEAIKSKYELSLEYLLKDYDFNCQIHQKMEQATIAFQ